MCGDLRAGIPKNRQDVAGQGFGSPEGLRWLTLLFSPSSPGRDPPVRRLQPAHPGQVHPQGAGPALAQLLPQVRRLPHAAGRALLLPGRQRLLQGGFLQVSSTPLRQRLPARGAGAQPNLKHNFSKNLHTACCCCCGNKGMSGLCRCCRVDAARWDVTMGKPRSPWCLCQSPVPPPCWCSAPGGVILLPFHGPGPARS